jgi:hypothetical protein
MLKDLLTSKNVLVFTMILCLVYLVINHNNKESFQNEHIHEETYISPMHSHVVTKKRHYHEFKQPPPEDTCPAVMKTVYGTDFDASGLSNKEKKMYGNRLIKNFNNIQNARTSCLSELEQIGDVKQNTDRIIDKNLDKMQVDLGVINPKLAYNCCIQTECKDKTDDALLECKQSCCNTFSCANFPVEPAKQLETVVNDENYESVNIEEEGINSESFPNYKITVSEESNIPVASNISGESEQLEENLEEVTSEVKNLEINEEVVNNSNDLNKNLDIDSEIEQNMDSITNKINKLNQKIVKQNKKQNKKQNNKQNKSYIDIDSTQFNQASNKDNVLNYDVDNKNQFINVNTPSNSFNNYADFKIQKNTNSIIPDDNLNVEPQKLGFIVPSGFNNA